MPLKHNAVLAFDGMSCHIEEVIGQGYNSIVYRGWYQDNMNQDLRHHVLVKELFPFHPDRKIRRLDDGSILVEPEGKELWENHKESFEIGNHVHLRLLYEQPELMVMGANLNSFQYNGTLYSVLGYSGGRSLQEELNHGTLSLRRTARLILGLLDALEPFHESGYLHLDISPDNIMLVGRGDQERQFMIDYNTARRIGDHTGGFISYKSGYFAPEVYIENIGAIGIPSDLYSVAAVFFRCIMGRKLTVHEMQQPEPPDAMDSPILKDVPQPVSAMVAAILKKGLHTLPRRRYQSIGKMRQAVQELLDRIDCVGVTHWSLWQNGRRSVDELLCINPSLRYLKEEKRLYPIRLELEYSMSLRSYLDWILSTEGRSGMILAQGGMGKTTLLLHTAMLQGIRYSAASPAVFYISLSGWDKADTKYIRSQILMRLRFKKEENTFDSAMHALRQVLEHPLRSKNGQIPSVLLLLDGLNEVRGDIAPLVQEINELNRMAGVRIIAASRSAIPELELDTAKLMPLNTNDVEQSLGQNGLLIPKEQAVLQLLRTPLILSIYIQASEGGRQLDIGSEEELMQAYMDALLAKEIRDLPEDSPLRWQIDAALNYVLPVIAAEIRKRGKALSEQQMLRVVKKCRKILSSRMLQKLFPQWIGHSKDIFWDVETTDQWYGIIIHRLLWQQMGMLAKDSCGAYSVFHQVVGEYLAEKNSGVCKRVVIIQAASAAAAAVLILVLGGLLYRTIPLLSENRLESAVVFYDEEDTQDMISRVAACYTMFNNRHTQIKQLLSMQQENNVTDFLRQYDRYYSTSYPEDYFAAYHNEYLEGIEALTASGEQVEWSRLEFDGDSASMLVTEAEIQLQQYGQLLPLLRDWLQSERAQKFCPVFPQKVEELVILDGKIMSKLYYLSCQPHLQTGEEPWRGNVMELIAAIEDAGVEPQETLETMLNARTRLTEELASLSATVRLTCESEENK